jgi:thiosulfate/3-mercaptopyruvate sulfurtransferase
MGYANPEVLVSTEWVATHLDDPKVRVVEVDVDTTAYDEGHVPGSVGWNWQTDLCDTLRRDIVPRGDLEALLGEAGVTPDMTVVLYGDNNNWFACWAYWQLKMYGHRDVRIMNGGRKKWILEGRPLSTDEPEVEETEYEVAEPDSGVRAFLNEVMTHSAAGGTLVDVRSPDEYTGRILAPPGLPETCQRGGHIPGAQNIPWGANCNEDGTFKSAEELRALYEERGVTPEQEVVAYCRIGERSSLTWFALKELLGYPRVKNYDGSWTEWGNLVGAPVVTGMEPR